MPGFSLMMNWVSATSSPGASPSSTLPCLVEVDGMRDLLGGAPDELVGTLQVVIAVQRLVDLVRERRLVVGVGARRVEIFRRPRQDRHEDRVRLLGAQRVRIVRHLAAARQRRVRRPERAGRPSASSIAHPARAAFPEAVIGSSSIGRGRHPQRCVAGPAGASDDAPGKTPGSGRDCIVRARNPRISGSNCAAALIGARGLVPGGVDWTDFGMQRDARRTCNRL